jgi:hypothetical protein
VALADTPLSERTQNIWDLLAFVSRYGHQSVSELLAMPVKEVAQFADALQRLMDREGDPMHERMAGG